MNESDIMRMIVSDQSWEQIIQEVITSESMDPWDLDVCRLSEKFSGYIGKLETMDFKVPAKYVIIASVLLRMKSDDLQILDFGREPEDDFEPQMPGAAIERVDVNPLTMPPRRMVHRKIVVEELISALRRVLDTQDRRETRSNVMPSIEISNVDIEERINSLYGKINGLMSHMNGGELKFTDVVPKWERAHIVETFLPLMHLDNERKVQCRQDEYFKDIFIGKVDRSLSEARVIGNEAKGIQKAKKGR